MDELVQQGVKIVAPPTWMLVRVDNDNQIVPSVYAQGQKPPNWI